MRISHIIKVGRYENGDAYVEFEDYEPTRYAVFNSDQSISWEWKKNWRIVENDLLTRIENGKKYKLNIEIEERALSLMRDRTINP